MTSAKTIVWAARMILLAGMIYIALWLALRLILVLTLALLGETGRRFETEDIDTAGLRSGDAGFGFYTSGGERIDPHDPNNPYDS